MPADKDSPAHELLDPLVDQEREVDNVAGCLTVTLIAGAPMAAGGADVEHASALDGPRPTPTARNYAITSGGPVAPCRPSLVC
jgi:hypothetical protein